MAGEISVGEMVNNSGIVQVLNTIPGLSGLIKIGQVAGIIVIIYILFLILRGFFQAKQTLRMGKLLDNVKEINHKMDILIKTKTKIGSKKSKKP